MRRLSVLLAAAVWAVSSASPAAAASPQSRLRTALSRSLKQAGGATGAYVFDLTTGKPLFSSAAGAGRMPASVEKLYTTSTALLRFGPDATLKTEVLGVGSVDPTGLFTGTLYLKGGGDPTFGSAGFDRTAYGAGATMQRLVRNLITVNGISSIQGRIVGDESYFDSLRGTPATGYQADVYVEGTLSALAYDRGFLNPLGTSFQTRPALYATQQFVSALKAAGVKVANGVRIYTGRAPASAQTMAVVHSPSIATLIRLTNTPSDNFFAEMIVKGIGARFGGAGTTSAGAAVVRAQIASSFGIHPLLDDGSGLSRTDRSTPRQVVTLLRKMAGNRAFTNSLAVAGQSGTMRYEMVGTRAQGRCRGKTGTLTDTASLVGYCSARDGHQLAFAFLMNSVDPVAGHAIEDRMGVTLANYNG